MIVIYGYVPAWSLPDISPYVTKVIVFLKLANIPFEYVSQSLATLDTDSPFGKLPYIIDTDTNDKVGDSNTIIKYLTKKHNVTLDDHLSPTDHAVSVAFDRLACEHLYWSGIIQPRWKSDDGWEEYIPHIVNHAEVGPELRAALDAFRVRILAGFAGQGMGRRGEDVVLDFYKADIDAVADFLGDREFLMGGSAPTTVDAGVYAMLRHCVGQPQKWKGTGYVESKENLVGYLERMKGVCGF